MQVEKSISSHHANPKMSVWEALTDDQGQTYYYNSATQETSWTLPENEAPETPKNSWIAYTTDDGTEYYYNEATQETTWDKPADYGEPVAVATGKEETAAESQPEPQPTPGQQTLEKSDVDLQLESKPIVKTPIVEPPKFDSYAALEEAFKELLRANDVDSTWSFESVMAKFIKEPVYWAILDSLQRKTLYDDYLIQKLQDQVSNKAAVIDSFKTNFLKVLDVYTKQGKLDHTTRWSTITALLIKDDNSIFKHSVLSDSEIQSLYRDHVSGLKRAHEESIKSRKQQALQELESYLTQINPALASQSDGWDDLYAKLQLDSRFQANKHFSDLSKLDILDLYISKIYPTIVEDTRQKIKLVERTNFRSDRKARESFKKLIASIPIKANSLFEDVFPLIENEDAFIELCGRNGSSPLEFFWDIVDEKNQVLKVKKDLVESVLLDLRRNDREKYDYESVLSSKETFLATLQLLEDERLSGFDFTATAQDNEIEMIYDTLKREHTLEKERAKVNFDKSLKHRVERLAGYLAHNFATIKAINVVKTVSGAEECSINIVQNTQYALHAANLKDAVPKLRLEVQETDEYQQLKKTVDSFHTNDSEAEIVILAAIEDSIRDAIPLMNSKLAQNDRKRVVREDEPLSKRLKREDPQSAPKSSSKPPILNY